MEKGTEYNRVLQRVAPKIKSAMMQAGMNLNQIVYCMFIHTYQRIDLFSNLHMLEWAEAIKISIVGMLAGN